MQIIKNHPVFQNVYLSQSISESISERPNTDFILQLDQFIASSYSPFYDDFGPMNLGTIHWHAFCGMLLLKIQSHPDRSIVIEVSGDCRAFTNAVFLLGAYMIMHLKNALNDIEEVFAPLSHMVLPFRDVSPGPQTFSLYVRDCWAGLCKAKLLSWVDFGSGGFDDSDYAVLDNPLNADLHEVVPGKILAMRGPKDLAGGARWADTPFGGRDFSPAHYAEILAQFDVQEVVRLNAREYDAEGFRTAGFAVADLCFDDCTAPPVEVVAAFLELAEGLQGALAVHCKAGLGRTGTLIALYMMKHHGFTASEAMGWLRVVRPGSVIGPQQQFLCDKEALMHECGEAFRLRGGGRRAPMHADADLEAVEAYVAAALRDVRTRAAGVAAREGVGGDVAEEDDAAEELAAHVEAMGNRRSGQRSLRY